MLLSLCTPRHGILLSFSSNAQLVSKMSHFCFPALPRPPQGILGSPLSCLGKLSPPDMFCASFSECILLRQVSLYTVPSHIMSFSDRSLCTQFLLRLCPSQTSLSKTPGTTVHQCPMMFLGRVLLSRPIPCLNTQLEASCHYVVRWSAG